VVCAQRACLGLSPYLGQSFVFDQHRIMATTNSEALAKLIQQCKSNGRISVLRCFVIMMAYQLSIDVDTKVDALGKLQMEFSNGIEV